MPIRIVAKRRLNVLMFGNYRFIFFEKNEIRGKKGPLSIFGYKSEGIAVSNAKNRSERVKTVFLRPNTEGSPQWVCSALLGKKKKVPNKINDLLGTFFK